MTEYRPSSKKQWARGCLPHLLALVGILVGLPGFVLALRDQSLRRQFELIVATGYEGLSRVWLPVCLLLILLALSLAPIRNRLTHGWARFRGAILQLAGCQSDPCLAARENPHYREALQKHVLLLGLSSWQLACRSEINYFRICFFRRLPWYVPQARYLRALRQALLLPTGYFQRDLGRRYSAAFTEQRLQHFCDLGFSAIAREEVRRFSPQKRAQILKAIETQRWEELEEKGCVLR